MKPLPVALLAAAVSAASAAAAHFALPPAAAPADPAGAAAPGGPEAGDLRRRVESLEARIDELSGALARARGEAAAAREDSRREAEALRAETAGDREKAEAAAKTAAEAAKAVAERKPGDLDAFAREASQAMRQGLRQEFKRIADLITAPTPEALEARRRQLKFVAQAFGSQAGLDAAQTATLERVLNDTDDRAREDLRPLLQGVEDYRQVDYKRVRKVAEDAFVSQDAEFEKEFPKDKVERLKAAVNPVRNLFGAMIDELERQSAAPAGQ